MTKILAVLVAVVGLVFLLTILAPLLGGISAWVVGLAFPSVLDTIRTVVGLDVSNFTIGATLGFVAAFFRSSISAVASK